MENIVTLVMGDPSNDGHGQVGRFTYKSNYTSKQIQEAYKKSCELLGFDFINECCEEYEDGLVPERFVNVFVEKGILFHAPDKSEDGYCPEQTCKPCHAGLCVREGDWGTIEGKTNYNAKDASGNNTYEKFPDERGLSFNDCHNSHADIYILIVKLTLENLIMEKCSEPKNEIYIGGYGLFWS